MKRLLRVLAAGALGAAVLVAPGAGTAQAADPAPQPVRPAEWADTPAEQNAVLDYWYGDDLARWDFENVDYDVPKMSHTDRGRPWSDMAADTAAVTRSVGRLFMRQNATFKETTRTARADDVVGAVRETGAFKAWDQDLRVLVEADANVPAERRFLETSTITKVANGQTTEVRRLSWPTNCSATSVDSDNGRTIVTAGHCVMAPVAIILLNSVGKGFANDAIDITNDNMVFVPGYDGTRPTVAEQAPYGVWVVDKAYTTGQWHAFGSVGLAAFNAFNMQHDVAALTVVDPSRPGVRLADVVGSQHIGFNGPVGKLTYAMGYPAAPASGGPNDETDPEALYDGRSLIFSKGPATRDLLMSLEYQIDCNMSGGSSGGPMLQDFSTETGVGTVMSVISFKYPWKMDLMNGPYFNNNIKGLYDTVRVL